jgi:hypothetical protein
MWIVGTLANQASAVLHITALVISPGALVNSAEVGALETDPDLSNNDDSATETGTEPILSKRFLVGSANPVPLRPDTPAQPLRPLATLLSDIAFIDLEYQDLLGIAPSASQMAHWMNFLLLGGTRQKMMRSL